MKINPEILQGLQNLEILTVGFVGVVIIIFSIITIFMENNTPIYRFIIKFVLKLIILAIIYTTFGWVFLLYKVIFNLYIGSLGSFVWFLSFLHVTIIGVYIAIMGTYIEKYNNIYSNKEDCKTKCEKCNSCSNKKT